MLKLRRLSAGLACVLGGAVLLATFVGVSPAFAEAPWWHLTSGARPTYLQPNPSVVAGVNEVQEIIMPIAEDKERENKKVAGFELAVNGLNGQLVGRREFVTQPFAAEFGLPTPTKENLQVALEELEPYYTWSVSGNSAGEEPTALGDLEPLTVTTVGPRPSLGISSVGLESQAEGRVVTEDRLGASSDELVVEANNVGDAPAQAGATLTDTLPAGLRAVGVSAQTPEGSETGLAAIPCRPVELSGARVTCEVNRPLAPYSFIEMRIAVSVELSAHTGELNQVGISGGDAVSASLSHAIAISDQPAPFGIENYGLSDEEEGGASDTQAGSHPFESTFTVGLNQTADSHSLMEKPEVNPVALPKDLNFKLPAGWIGNPTAIPRCSIGQFLTEINEENECPADSAVGVATVTIHEPGLLGAATFTLPLFNLEPRTGEPARFGFLVTAGNAPVFIDTSVRTGGDYGVTVEADNITQTAGFISSEVSVWGVPGDPSHNNSRGWGCLKASRGGPESACQPATELRPPPFLAMPGSCTGPLRSVVEGDSWDQPEGRELASGETPALDGCNRLPFAPSIKIAPDGQQASTPSGLTVDVQVPQEESVNPNGFAEADPKDITVTLPQGVTVNPAGANGLEACSEGLIGFTGFAEFENARTATFTPKLPEPVEPGGNFCPDGSKIATVKIKTPILPNPLEGAVYLATQNANPFGSLIALYIVAEDPVSGVLVKLPGEVSLNQQTGQITTTFENSPQAPFEDAEFHFFGGERAPLATPAHCGTYTTTTTVTPWSGNEAEHPSSSFAITSGPNHGPCENPLAFAPTLAAGSINNQAGAFSPFTMTMSREDGTQNLKSVELRMPPGLAGILTGIPLCGEAQADAGTCGPESLIGETTVSVGLGGDPYTVKGGQVYLTGPYEGAPFGLSVVNPAVAGPFNLGKVVVRARLEIDPHTAQVTVTSDSSGPYAIPPSIDGIPLEIKHVNVTINREHFTFNPTSCNPLQITGTLDSIEGASQSLSLPFQATNCATLKFAPQFTVSTSGKTSKADGASLTTKIVYPATPPGGQATNYANIADVKVDLPKALPSRLTTLQKACLASVFEANPADCPAASIVGHARVTTPLLPVPLEGPAYFVSHGNEAFPSLTMVLQGYGVTIDLVGSTFIKDGITSSTFRNTPDAPLSTFELTLPEGKYSALAANGNLCKTTLNMPTAFTAQNGIQIHETTKIKVAGCAKPKPKKAKKVKKREKRKR